LMPRRVGERKERFGYQFLGTSGVIFYALQPQWVEFFIYMPKLLVVVCAALFGG